MSLQLTAGLPGSPVITNIIHIIVSNQFGQMLMVGGATFSFFFFTALEVSPDHPIAL